MNLGAAGPDIRVMTLADVFERLAGLLSMVGQIMIMIVIVVPLALVTSLTIPWLALFALIFAPTGLWY